MTRADDDDFKMGRLVDDHWLSRRSSRVGPTGRTFHIQVKSTGRGNGGAAKAIAGLDYNAREGKHARRRDELELEGGRDRREMAEIVRAAERANQRKNGKISLSGEIELPARFTAVARKAAAEGIAQWFESRGCPAHWAIHTLNDRKEFQPHLHWTASARPVVQVGGRWVGTAPGRQGEPVKAVIAGPAAMQAFRRDIAGIINSVAGEHRIELEAAWSGGRLADTGIERPAKARLPIAVYKARERIEPHDDGPAQTSHLIDQGHFEQVRGIREAWRLRATEEASARQADAQRRRQERRERITSLRPAEVASLAPAATTRSARPLSDVQRELLRDVAVANGIELPDDLDTNGDAQAEFWRMARQFTRQSTNRRTMKEQKLSAQQAPDPAAREEQIRQLRRAMRIAAAKGISLDAETKKDPEKIEAFIAAHKPRPEGDGGAPERQVSAGGSPPTPAVEKNKQGENSDNPSNAPDPAGTHNDVMEVLFGASLDEAAALAIGSEGLFGAAYKPGNVAVPRIPANALPPAPAVPTQPAPVEGEVIQIKAGTDGEPDRQDARRVADRLVAMPPERLVAAWTATQAGLRRARSQMRDPIDVARMRELEAGARLIMRAAAQRGLVLPARGSPPTSRPGQER